MITLKIIIPSYRRPDKLKELLDSIYELVKDNIIHISVVEDGSGEGYRKLYDDIEQQYPKVMFFRIKKNVGAAASRNIGLYENPRTQWVWFLDDDDAINKSDILKIKKILDNGINEDIIFLSGKFVGVNNTKIVNPTGLNLFSRLRTKGNEINTSCAIIKTSLLEKAGGWDDKLVAGQDTDLFIRMALFSDAMVFNDVVVLIDQRHIKRITSKPWRQIKGKVQFLVKNWPLLSIKLRIKYLISLLLFWPFVRVGLYWLKKYFLI